MLDDLLSHLALAGSLGTIDNNDLSLALSLTYYACKKVFKLALLNITAGFIALIMQGKKPKILPCLQTCSCG